MWERTTNARRMRAKYRGEMGCKIFLLFAKCTAQRPGDIVVLSGVESDFFLFVFLFAVVVYLVHAAIVWKLFLEFAHNTHTHRDEFHSIDKMRNCTQWDRFDIIISCVFCICCCVRWDNRRSTAAAHNICICEPRHRIIGVFGVFFFSLLFFWFSDYSQHRQYLPMIHAVFLQYSPKLPAMAMRHVFDAGHMRRRGEHRTLCIYRWVELPCGRGIFDRRI